MNAGERKLSPRMERVKNELIDNPVRVDTERLRVLLESYKKTEGLPTVLRRAIYFDDYLSSATIFIDENPLVGNFGKYKPCAMPWVEISCRWMTKKLEGQRVHDTLGEYEISEEAKRDIEDAVEYWSERCAYTRARSLFEESSGIHWPTMAKTGMYVDGCGIHWAGSICPEPARAAVIGLRAQLEKIAEQESNLPPVGTNDNMRQRYFLRSARIALEAVIKFGHRYASLAREMAQKEKDSERKRELETIAKTMEWVPENPPRNFYEAMQSLSFIYICSMTEMSCPPGLAIGNIGRSLNSFYKKDLEEGSITENEAIELLQGFFAKVLGCAIFASNVYSTAAQGFNPCRITMGGYTKDGQDGTTDLDYLLVEAQRQMRLIEPGLACYYTNKMPEDFLVKCVELIRDSGLGQPQFHNMDLTIEKWLYHYDGVSLEDARERTVLGSCIVSCLGNLSNTPWEGAFNMAKMVELALHNGVDPTTGKKAGVETGDADNFKTYEEFHDAVRKQFAYCMEMCRYFDTMGFQIQAEIWPIPFTSGLVDVCIESRKDLSEGAQPYGEMGPIIVGNIDLGNSMAAVKKVVFEDKKITLKELKAALAANFEGNGYGEIHSICLNAPKYGNDDPYVDNIVREWFDIAYEESTKQPDFYGRPAIPEAYSHSLHWHTGSRTGALPSGRKAWLALCDGSVSAQAGTDRQGPLALAKSAAKALDGVRFSSNHLNMKFPPSALADAQGIRNLLSLVKTYFDLGGYHVQFNCLNNETLIDAQAHPENYKDLVVRVAGFSALFTRLDKGIQDEIIRRTMLNFD